MQRILVRSIAMGLPILVAACGGGGGGSGSTGTTGLPAATPTVALTSAKTEVSRGDTTSLTWSSTDATRCEASGAWSGTKAIVGSETVAVSAESNSYVLACSGRGGSAQTSVQVAGLNEPPIVVSTPPERTVTVNKPLALGVGPGLFSDPNGDGLTLSITRADASPLPAWLAFNGRDTLTGTPGWDDVGPLALAVHADDGHGGKITAPLTVKVEYLRHQTCAGERIEDTGLSNGPVQMGEYIPVNSYGTDMWSRYPGFGACATAEHIGPQTVRAEWSWQIPLPPNYDDSSRFPFGYPSIVYGVGMMPWQTYQTTEVLPVAVKDFPDLKVDMDLSIDYDDQGQLNTLLDVIVAPDLSNLTQIVDLMITPMRVRVPQGPVALPVVQIGEFEYWSSGMGFTQPHMWYPDVPDSYLRSTQFTAVTPFTSASVRIKPFLDYALAQGWIEPTDMVINIQFGVEPNAGSGSAVLRSFSITSDP